MASATPSHSPFSTAPSTSRRRKSPPNHHIILSPLTAKPTSKMPLTTSHRSLDIIACKATEVSQPSSLASASSGEDGKSWVPVVPLSALPKGERRVIIQDGETILLLWYKDDVVAIENRSPAEGAYSEGLLNAKLTQHATNAIVLSTITIVKAGGHMISKDAREFKQINDRVENCLQKELYK